MERVAAQYPDVPQVIATHEEFRQVTGYETTRGALACFARPAPLDPAALLKDAHRVAILEDITNYTNIGAIFRSAAALNIDAVLLGIISSITGSIMLDRMMAAAQSREVVAVITRRQAQVAQAIQTKLHRGTTILSARGGYSGEQSDTILCACTHAQTYTLRDVVYGEDAQAFVMILEASAVLGNGFQPPESWS